MRSPKNVVSYYARGRDVEVSTSTPPRRQSARGVCTTFSTPKGIVRRWTQGRLSAHSWIFQHPKGYSSTRRRAGFSARPRDFQHPEGHSSTRPCRTAIPEARPFQHPKGYSSTVEGPLGGGFPPFSTPKGTIQLAYVRLGMARVVPFSTPKGKPQRTASRSPSPSSFNTRKGEAPTYQRARNGDFAPHSSRTRRNAH